MQHNMEMVKYNLNYAKDELTNAINNIKNFVMINYIPLYKSNIDNIKSRIENQVKVITYQITPEINKMR